MLEMYLVRHGETLWNQDHKYQGHQDVPLSEVGRRQAKELAHWLKEVRYTAIYASDLSRAYDTAAAVADSRAIKVTADRRLREINFGTWEGRTFKEINKIFPDIVKQWMENPAEVNLPEGESFALVKKRAYQAVKDIVAKNEYAGKVAVFSHGATIRTILCSVLDLPLKAMWQIEQGNTAVNIIKFPKNHPPIISLLNSTCHLQ
ncbi:alpha-ribazole phosphatase [Metallumcola ferriviriculae]|uniref:Alpha-ribazole phosphatase n=1 Tax=Metallumcola ferriviriculae TaxID=3039180 RepID=A0AAU0UUR3_9FIRM|nr:alpha-ribazole phosphatase [Desulfitibacteraceae bacterium MK1]